MASSRLGSSAQQSDTADRGAPASASAITPRSPRPHELEFCELTDQYRHKSYWMSPALGCHPRPAQVAALSVEGLDLRIARPAGFPREHLASWPPSRGGPARQYQASRRMRCAPSPYRAARPAAVRPSPLPCFTSASIRPWSCFDGVKPITHDQRAS